MGAKDKSSQSYLDRRKKNREWLVRWCIPVGSDKIVEVGVKASQRGCSLVLLWKYARVRSPVTFRDPGARHECTSTFASFSFFFFLRLSYTTFGPSLKVSRCLLVFSFVAAASEIPTEQETTLLSFPDFLDNFGIR